MYEVLKPEDGRGTAAKIERGTAAKTYLFLYEVLKLEEVLLQQRQACLVEALHGRVHSPLHQCNQGPEGVLFIHVQQQQPSNEPHALHIPNLHSTTQMVQ